MQAQVDFQEIVNGNHSNTGVLKAKEFIEHLKELLSLEKRTSEMQKPGSDWDTYILLLKARCW